MASTTNTNIPDFNVPGHGFRSAVAGTEKLRNIPATTEADRILAEIQRLIDEAEQTRLMIQQTRHENREQFTRLQQSLLTTIQTRYAIVSPSHSAFVYADSVFPLQAIMWTVLPGCRMPIFPTHRVRFRIFSTHRPALRVRDILPRQQSSAG